MSTEDSPHWCETCQAWGDHTRETHPNARVRKAMEKHRRDAPESIFVEATPREFREVLDWSG